MIQTVSDLLQEAKVKKNYSRHEMSDLLKVSYTDVSRWLRGHSIPNWDKLSNISEKMGIPVEKLICAKMGKDEDYIGTLGYYIVKYMVDRKYTARYMHHMLYVHRAGFYNWINNKFVPHKKTLKLMQALGFPREMFKLDCVKEKLND